MSKIFEKFIKRTIIFCLKLFFPQNSQTRIPADYNSFNRVLIFRLDNRLGNSILILSLVQAIKRRAPKMQIDIMMTARFLEIYQQHPDIHELIPYDQNYLLSRPWRYLYLLQNLRRRKYDIVFSSSNPNAFSISQALLGRLMAPQHTVGFDWQESSRIYTDVVRGNIQIHYAAAQVGLWRYFDPQAEYERPRLYLSQEDKLPANKLLFWLGATGNKKLPAELIIKLTDIFSGLSIKYDLAAGPADRGIIEILPAEMQRQVMILSGSVRETAAVFKNYKVICIPDTGPLHLAAALNIPLIQVFSGSNSTWYAYRGENFLLIDKVLDARTVQTFLRKYFPANI
jgi:heptosyltransferase-3